jgi:hypothetical protein
LGHEGSRPGIGRTKIKVGRKEIGQEGNRTGSKYDRKKTNEGSLTCRNQESITK